MRFLSPHSLISQLLLTLVLLLLQSAPSESAAPYVIPGTTLKVDVMILGADSPNPSSCELQSQLLSLPQDTFIGSFPLSKVTKTSSYCDGTNAIVFKGATIQFQVCAKDLPGGFRICWSADATEAQMAVQLRVDGGWVGFAFTSGGSSPMIGSNAVIGSQDQFTPSLSFAGPVMLQTKDDQGNGIHLYNTSALNILSADVENNAGVTTLLFTRTATFIPNSNEIDIAFATGPAPTYGSGTPLFRKHNDKHYGSLNLVTGVFTEVTDDVYRTAHAVLMTCAWALMLPCGIIAARFFKSDDESATPWWFHFHRAFQISGLSVATAGFVIGLFVIGSKTYMTHRILGICVMSFGYFQPFNALIRPEWKPGVPTMKRRIWEILHKNNGRATVLAALVNIYIGLSILQPGVLYVAIVSIVISAWAITAIALEIRARRCKRQPVKQSSELEFGHMDVKNDSPLMNTH